MNTSADLRSRRTRKWLQEALVALMKEKPFKQIQITEIADRAEVSRPAFYLHFRSKEELLLSHVDMVLDEFHREARREIETDNIDRVKISILLFQHWEKHADTLRMVIEAEAQSALIARLRLYADLIHNEMRAKQKKGAIPAKSLHEYEVDFLAGGAYMLLTRWMENCMLHSAEQMGVLFYELARACQNYST